MPTILSHAAVPLALGLGLGIRVIPKQLLVAGIVASIIPDLDVLAFRLNIAYSHDLGHRGVTHSVVFALVVALLALAMSQQLRCSRAVAFSFVGLSAVSHGLLDMITNGGLGVALWWPWSSERFFAAWQVIEVSPLSLSRVFSSRGLAVLQSELLWVWLPAVLVATALLVLRVMGSNIAFKRGAAQKRVAP
ncbi:MAG: metal-dependent hydrolase [Gallionellaceae bacterium]|jgi:inner membrane protein